MFSTRKSLAVLAIVGALGFAGCGDDDNDTSSTTTTESGTSGAAGATGESGTAVLPADFIAEADAICDEGDKAIDEEAGQTFEGGQEPSAQEQARFVEDVVVPNIQQQLDDLEALDPPEEGAEEFQTLIDEANDAIDQIEADPEAFIGGDDPFTEVNQLAQGLGLEECGGDD